MWIDNFKRFMETIFVDPFEARNLNITVYGILKFSRAKYLQIDSYRKKNAKIVLLEENL